MQDAIRPGMRQRLGAKLLHVRAMMSPRTYLENPWLRLGVATVIGYQLGRPAPTKRGRASAETVLGALVRTVLVNVAISTMRDAIGPKTAVVNRPIDRAHVAQPRTLNSR